jgi:hypothetical protein
MINGMKNPSQFAITWEIPSVALRCCKVNGWKGLKALNKRVKGTDVTPTGRQIYGSLWQRELRRVLGKMLADSVIS